MEFQTNTTVSETHVQVNLRWDPGYVKTLPGALKVVAVVSYNYELILKSQLSHLHFSWLIFWVLSA